MMSSGAGQSGAAMVLEDVHKNFGPLSVLAGINLTIGRGEKVVIIGPSGGGKSTLLRCINLLLPIDRGRIVLEGAVITSKGTSANTVRRRIGMVFQQFDLFPHLKVIDNLILAPRLVLKEPPSQAIERAHELLARVGLMDKTDKYPHQLSGGQQQRVAIVRAMMMKPEIMLFDEVTSALDPELAGEVLDTIEEIALTGVTMVIVTHEMQFACEIGDRMVFISGGVVVEEGLPADMLSDPKQDRTRQFFQRVRRFH